MAMQGPQVIAEKLAYFINTGEMVQVLLSQGIGITNVQLAKFSPSGGNPSAPATSPAIAPAAPVAVADASSGKRTNH